MRRFTAIAWLWALGISLANLTAAVSTNGMRDLTPFLEDRRHAFNFPALAAAVVREDRVIAAGVTGERKAGSGVAVTWNDRFHIGSCTKSMTGLLAAELAREGKITLDARPSDVFPEWKLEGEKRQITLELLLQNRSGLGNKPEPDLWSRAFKLSGTPSRQRAEFLKEFLAQPLEAAPATKYIYSNMGFALAGAMLERKAGSSWEELVERHIFQPLGLKEAGFGAPATPGRIDQPWGHQLKDGKLEPIEPSDNPVVIAPAGAVHLSLMDAAAYGAFQVKNFGRDRMYTPPPGSDYAYGWIVQQRPWGGGTVLTHAGSNTMFYAVIWVAPVKGCALVVMTNVGESNGQAISGQCDQVVAALIKEFVQ